jgi:sensor c-di-GMP phosphodiesterase-like protein
MALSTGPTQDGWVPRSGVRVNRQSLLKGLLPYLVAILVAVSPLALGKSILRAHSNVVGNGELEGLADRTVMRVDRVIAEAISVLRNLDRDKKLSCDETSRIAFVEAASGSAFLRRVGLADENGYAMCLEPPPPVLQAAVLPPASEEQRQIVIAVTDAIGPEQVGSSKVMVGWNSLGGQRLVAELSSTALDIDAGATFLRDSRTVSVTIDGGKRWARYGAKLATSPEEGIASARLRSRNFPVEVTVAAETKSFAEITRSLEVTLTAGSLAVGVVLLGLTVWLTYRPDRQVDDEILTALRRKEFVPYYQPVMNIETGQIEGCELLVRWIRKDGTVVPPGRFMSYAETSGHVFEMTRALMRQSVVDLGPLFRRRAELKLSVNLFAGHFDDRRIIQDIEEIYGGGPIAFDQLVMEVTERYPLRDVEKARRIIAEMHTLGCRVALDDTGTGHGGLAYLQQLGIDIIKIDKMFIDAMGADLGASTIIDVLVELANSLGMGIVAEGVEREEQIERLKQKGVTAAQGYVFAPPLPAKLFLELATALVPAEEDEASGEGRAAA